MFAIAKTYQWYRGERSQEDESSESILKNKADERLLSLDKINLVKPELLQQTQSLMQRSITLAQHQNFTQLETNQQNVFFAETNEAFDVLKKQLHEFRYSNATVGDLFDIRYHLRDINHYLDEIENECARLNTVSAGLGLQ